MEEREFRVVMVSHWLGCCWARGKPSSSCKVVKRTSSCLECEVSCHGSAGLRAPLQGFRLLIFTVLSEADQQSTKEERLCNRGTDLISATLKINNTIRSAYEYK